MTQTAASLHEAADRGLARKATPSGAIFLLAWLIVAHATNVADELPVVTMAGIIMFMPLVVWRLVLGPGFDRFYPRMKQRRWQHAFGAIVLLNGASRGMLNAIVLWYYFPEWPAYPISLCSAGLAAGQSSRKSHGIRMHRRPPCSRAPHP
jgi:hypothetical protein